MIVLCWKDLAWLLCLLEMVDEVLEGFDRDLERCVELCKSWKDGGSQQWSVLFEL